MPRNHVLPRAVLIGLVAVLAASAWGLSATSSREFCLSCHEMSPQAEEQRWSSHALSADKKPVACAECHLPPGFGPRFVAVKIYSGLKDAVMHFFLPDGSQPGGGLIRAELQPQARRFVDDDNCLRCHRDLYKDARGEQAVSELGKIAHDSYLGKNGQARSNCAGCHRNLAHLPVFDRRLDANRAFAERIRKELTLEQARAEQNPNEHNQKEEALP
ncbi:MAG: NapC/NirT family cytochrome c [Desulfovibrio sp.]|jgi:nitrate/TMAO reductase-like tetraheme cytochrome c subunit|nr:NapC/NirT family cytochrome c [Desulfovibrio sp.]